LLAAFLYARFRRKEKMIVVSGKKKDVGISTAQTDFSSVWLAEAWPNKNHPTYSFCWCKIPNRAMDILYILLIKKERMAHITSTLFFLYLRSNIMTFARSKRMKKAARCALEHRSGVALRLQA
jgi:hypothetical protein